MKKSIILMAGLVGLAFTSCDDKSDLGVMQKNEAPVVVPADGVALQSLYTATGNKINLQDFEEIANIPLLNIEISKDFPASSVVTGLVEIASKEDFSDAMTIDLGSMEASSTDPVLEAAAGGNTRSLQGYVEMEAWENVFTSFYGLNPNPNVNYLRYKLWLTEGSQKVILYNQNGEEWWDAMEFTVTPLDSKLDVASSYTFHYKIGDQEFSQEMYHNPDKHVYDDPIFNATVEVGENETLYWWITPTGGTEVYGVKGDDPAETSGSLALIAEGEASNGQISEAGVYKVEVDMLGLTYDVKLAPPSLYVMCMSGTQFGNTAQLATTDNVSYEGMAGLTAVWALTGQAAYKPTLYVNNSAVERTNQNGVYSGGLLFDGSGTPISSSTGIPYPGTGAGLYYLTANLTTMTYTGYQCKQVGLVGSFNNWGNPDDDGNKAPDVDLKGSRTTLYMEWTGTITLAADDEWKIRMNSDWVVDFGLADGASFAADGSNVELAKGGANIVTPEAGTYNVTVYFRRYLDEEGNMTPYYMKVTPAE